MSVLARPALAALAAKALQRSVRVAARVGSRRMHRDPFPDLPRDTRELTMPTSVAPARAVVYRPATAEPNPPVHVNFHGGGFVMALTELDDPLCRFLAARAGVVVCNVDYAVAPQHPFPEPPHQAFEVVRWVAAHGAEHGWDGDRLSIGGQSAGGGLAAAVARQALEQGGPPISLQVLHYPPLDLATDGRTKRAAIARPMLRPWMAEIFDNAYVPDAGERADRLVSPANPADTADLTGIAPALVITAEFDLLRAEGQRYAERLRNAGALAEYYEVPHADHGYDVTGGPDNGNTERTTETYELIARHLRGTTNPAAPETG